jgi:hypothetical protein
MPNPNEKKDEPKAIDVEVVGKSVSDPHRAAPDEPRPRTFFHPASGVAILLIDWITFGIDVPTGFLFTLVSSLAAFTVTFAAVYFIQRKESLDSKARAAWKAFFGAVAAGVPFPITGTVLGAGILLLSGLPMTFRKK